jgi:hypothetical protein
MNAKILFIEKELAPILKKLNGHSLYKSLTSVKDIKVFMESHVYAVWDFMSLLKALQINLTTVSIPWVPKKNSNLVRFINEITVAEERDIDKDGNCKSHFEMYLDAMKDMHADTAPVVAFTNQITDIHSVQTALESSSELEAVKNFVGYTFEVIKVNKPHEIAAAFTFGREDIIPEMFLKIVAEASVNSSENYDNFLYYLNRHIELDGDEHGPLSLQMIEELCQDDQEKWDEVLVVAKAALQVRIDLWTGIEKQLLQPKEQLV